MGEDPKLYSGPSSCAGAVLGTIQGPLAEFFQQIYEGLNLEPSWITAPLENEFGTTNAPHLNLVDGWKEDNCGIIALVMQIQENAMKNEIEIDSIDQTLVGMCDISDIKYLLSREGHQVETIFEVFKLQENAVAQLQYKGKYLEVWAYPVVTLYEPMTGILPGSKFTIFGWYFAGMMQNYGFSNHSNYDLDKEDQIPQLSLLPGRGEYLEIQIAGEYMLEEMRNIVSDIYALELVDSVKIVSEEANSMTQLFHDNTAFYILALIGLAFTISTFLRFFDIECNIFPSKLFIWNEEKGEFHALA